MENHLLFMKNHLRMAVFSFIAIVVLLISFFVYWHFFANNVQQQALKIEQDLQKRIGSIELAMADGSKMTYYDWAQKNGLNEQNNGFDNDPSGSGIPNYIKYMYLTNPLNSDPNNKGFTDKQDIMDGYDPTGTRGARPEVAIIISKIGLNTKMLWNKEALTENSVLHLDKSATPGQNGNVVVSACVNADSKKVLENRTLDDIKDLAKGDRVWIKLTEKNGRVIRFPYIVIDKFIASVDDKRISEDTQNPTLTLVSCWKIDNSNKQLVVKSQLE